MKRHPSQNNRNRMIPFPSPEGKKETRYAAYCTKVSCRPSCTHNLRNDSPMGKPHGTDGPGAPMFLMPIADVSVFHTRPSRAVPAPVDATGTQRERVLVR